jgi:hypothetical protein
MRQFSQLPDLGSSVVGASATGRYRPMGSKFRLNVAIKVDVAMIIYAITALIVALHS